MATFTFDTHRVVKELQEAGFDETQAEVLVETLSQVVGGNLTTKDDLRDMATKSDLVELRGDMATKSDVRDMATKSDLAELRGDMSVQIANIRSEMQAMELRLTLRLGAIVVAAAGLVVAIQKLLS